jgi:hypothetical protein
MCKVNGTKIYSGHDNATLKVIMTGIENVSESLFVCGIRLFTIGVKYYSASIDDKYDKH